MFSINKTKLSYLILIFSILALSIGKFSAWDQENYVLKQIENEEYNSLSKQEFNKLKSNYSFDGFALLFSQSPLSLIIFSLVIISSFKFSLAVRTRLYSSRSPPSFC